MTVKFNKKIFFLLLFLLLFGMAAWYLFRKKPEPLDLIKNKSDTALVDSLEATPEFLAEEENLIELFRQKLLPGNVDEDEIKKELLLKFPGEKGRVVVRLFNQYLLLLEAEKIINEKQVFEFDRIPERKKMQAELFGKQTSQLLFPDRELDRIRMFYAFCEKFLTENTTLDSERKKIIIEKKRKEIYGNDYDKMITRQPFAKEFELRKNIMQAELGVMNETEKAALVRKIAEEIRNDQFPY